MNKSMEQKIVSKKGRVLTRSRNGVVVSPQGGGSTEFCRVPARGKGKRMGMPVPGDWIRYDAPTSTSDGWVLEIKPRSSLLQRYVFGRIKESAANMERVFILACPKEPEVSPRLVDRMLVGASTGGLEPVILINKSDLFHSEELESYCEQWFVAGYKVSIISALSGDGLKALEDELRGHVSLLAGASGVGKSTLLNRLIEDLNLDTSALSEASGRGVHTTAYTYLYPFPGGGIVADSPGLREFYPVIEPDDLHRHFPEFETLAEECEWNNCLHLDERGCAVREAAGTEVLHEKRYESYRLLYDSLKEGPQRGRRQPG